MWCHETCVRHCEGWSRSEHFYRPSRPTSTIIFRGPHATCKGRKKTVFAGVVCDQVPIRASSGEPHAGKAVLGGHWL